MGDVDNKISNMKFVSKKLELPIFLASRNRIRRNHYDAMRTYINRKSESYAKNCNLEHGVQAINKLKQLVGLNNIPKLPCPAPHATIFIRGMKIADWKLAPNRYGRIKEPYETRKGYIGAHWSKEAPAKQTRSSFSKFYEITVQSEHCSGRKGFFLGNARTRRGTLRCMMTDFQSCYRNPNDPGPANYFPKNYTIEYNAQPIVKAKQANPHIFLRRSCVPERISSIHLRNRSFEPGPGRYEVRFPNVCPCTWKLVYKPDLQLLIDRQKRLKFRRLPYTRIRAHKYCSPEFRHITGKGFRRLFKISKEERKRYLNPPKTQAKDRKVNESKEAKEAMKGDLKLYADGRYISVINDPPRTKISFRVSAPLRYSDPFKITFNCMQKHAVKHRLGINKNVAFGSGLERFKGVKRYKIFTVIDLKKIKKSLPAHLQLKEQPVTNTPPSKIKSKYEQVPLHMKPPKEVQLRKRLFKFLPLPTPKVLSHKEDVRVKYPVYFYNRDLDITQFLKKDSTSRVLDML